MVKFQELEEQVIGDVDVQGMTDAANNQYRADFDCDERE